MTKLSWEDMTYPSHEAGNYTTRVEWELPFGAADKFEDVVADVVELSGGDISKVVVESICVMWTRPMNDQERKKRDEEDADREDRVREQAQHMMRRLIDSYGPDPKQWPDGDQLKFN